MLPSLESTLPYTKETGARDHCLRAADLFIAAVTTTTTTTATDYDDDGDIDGGGGSEMGDVAAVKDDGRRRDYGVLRYLSPRKTLSRWLSSVKRPKERRIRLLSEKGREKVTAEEEEGGESGGGSAQIRCSTNGQKDGEPSSSNLVEYRGASEMADESGRYRKEICFNLGVGFGLFFLIATSKNELNKMVELRAEMEMLLENAKEELQRKDRHSKKFESNDNIAYSTIEAQEDSKLSLQYHALPYIQPGLKSSMLYDQSLKCDAPAERECVKGMDQLEAELEVELERLELRLGIEDLSKQPQQQSIEVNIEDTAPRGSLSTHFGELVDPLEASIGRHCGVPPDELERRLHEVVEARQQERIKELEAALECANHKIREKEIEASWWKDAALLISQRVPRNSQYISQHVSEASHFLR